MTAKRYYEAATVLTARIVNMRHLWEPSREFEGVPSQKPNYFYTCIVPKTRGGWWEEAAFAGLSAAVQKVMTHYQLQSQYVLEWPVKDGDMPDKKGRQSEWAKGHWVFGGSSSDPINVEIVQNGACVKIPNKTLVKPGDFVSCGLSVTVRKNDARSFKTYGNSVLFTAAGEEIVVGNSVSGAELMAQAQAQGLQVAGFSGSPGGFGPTPPMGGGHPYAPQGVGNPPPMNSGFAPPAGGQPGGFAPPQAAPQFAPQGAPGFAPGPFPPR